MLLAAERAAAAARADAAVLPAFCEMTAQLLGSLRHVDDAVRSIDDDCRQRRDAPPADEPPPPPPPPRPSPPPPLPPQTSTQLPCDEAMDAAAPDAPADPPPLVALGEASICATINDGTNAQLHDWLRLQSCAGARRIFLRDARSLDADAAAVARWMLEPFVEAGTLVLLNASAAAPPPSTTPADAALVPLFEGEWPPPRRAWLAGEARRGEAAQVQACLPHARDAGGWMAVVEAPYDLVVLNETAAAAADGGSEPTCEELRVPDAPAVRIAVAKYAASSDDAAALPPRPLSVTHAYRAAEFGRCALRSGALRVDIADTVLLVNPGRWAAGAAEAPAATALLAPTALGVRRFERAPLADGAELDPSAIALQLACDASTLALPQPPADGSAGDEWTAQAAVELADGDGATMLRQGVARSEALDLRRRLLARIPPEKQTTRVFANLMCQVYDGAAASPGLDPLCEPLDADLLRLATHGRALAVARTLLGETARLHNAGLALVFPPPHSADRPPSTDPHEAHQDQPINSAAAWAGACRRRRTRSRCKRCGSSTTLGSATARRGPSRAHSGGPSTSSCGRRTVRRVGSRAVSSRCAS